MELNCALLQLKNKTQQTWETPQGIAEQPDGALVLKWKVIVSNNGRKEKN